MKKTLVFSIVAISILMGLISIQKPANAQVSSQAKTLQVELAPDNPVSVTIPDGTLYTPVLKIELTAKNGDVTVTRLTLTRTGFIANTNVIGVSIWDDTGTRYGNMVTTLTPDGKATFSFGSTPLNTPLKIKNGETRTLTVKINLAASTGSATIGFNVNVVTDITVSGAVNIEGTLPIVGNIMGVVDVSNATADLRVDDQPVGGYSYGKVISSEYGNINVGDIQKEVAKFRFTQSNSKEYVLLKKLTVYVSGPIDVAKDLMNWKLYTQDGTLLASVDASTNRYINFVLATPYEIDPGSTRDLSVNVDIVGGAGKFFFLYILNNYDIYAESAIAEMTEFYILPTDKNGNLFGPNDTRNTATGYFKIILSDQLIPISDPLIPIKVCSDSNSQLVALLKGLGFTDAQISAILSASGITCKSPSITVLSPNGGEKWEAGKTYNIKYRIANPPTSNINNWEVSANVDCLDWNRDWSSKIFGSHYLIDDKRSIQRTIPFNVDQGYNCKAQVKLTNIASGGMYESVISYEDFSDTPFSIIATTTPSITTPSITVISPNGGETLIENSRVVDSLSGVDSRNNIFTIKWSGAPDSFTDVSGDGKDPARIEAYLEQNNNGQFSTIGRIIPDAAGSIMWIIGQVSDTNCLLNNYNATLYPNHCNHSRRLVSPGNYYVRIVDTKTGVMDRSDNYFSIVAAGTSSMTVVKNSSFGNTSYAVGSQNVKIGEFVLQNSSAEDIAVSSIGLDVAYPLNIQNLKLKKTDGTQLGATQNSSGTVVFGTGRFIVKKSESAIISVYADIKLGATGITSVMITTYGVGGTGVSSGAELSKTPPSRVNGQTITISANAPSITVLSPNGGEKWEVGKSYLITWQSKNFPAKDTSRVQVNIRKEGDSLGYNILNNQVNDGSEIWTIPSTYTIGNYRIQVVGVYDGTIDESDAPFSIVAATTSLPTLTITRDPESPASRIIINGQTNVEVAKIKLEAKNSDVIVRKITFYVESADITKWVGGQVALNISKAYLYDGAIKLAESIVSKYPGISTDKITFSDFTATFSNGAPRTLTVKIDASGAENSYPKVVGKLSILSVQPEFLEAYAPSLMTSGISAVRGGSDYMLFTNSAPTIKNAWTSGTISGTLSIAAPIGKYTITNTGTRDITISRMDVVLLINGATTSKSALQNVALWEESTEGVAIAKTNIGGTGKDYVATLNGVANTTASFYSFTQKNIIAAGSSKTYIISANTIGIESLMSNPGQNTATIHTCISCFNGLIGYNTTDFDGPDELYWFDGEITYSYTGVGINSGVKYSGLNASDSPPIEGPTLQY